MTCSDGNKIASFNTNTTVFDNDGNMTSGPLNGQSTTFTYNSRSQLTNVLDTSYEYDSEGRRTRVTVANETIEYLVNPLAGYNQVLIETDSAGIDTYYVYGLGLISKEINSVPTYYHFDYRGSTVALTTSTEDITDTYTYDPYGNITSRTGSSENVFEFNGKYGVVSDSNGLVFMMTRYYNKDIKRFINRDSLYGSIDQILSTNQYLFALGNPVNLFDPKGMWPEDTFDRIWIVDADGNERTMNRSNKGTGNITSMQVSQDLIDFIKEYETFEPEAYRGQDSQNETIGFGHVIKPGEQFGTITIEEAEELLRQDLQSRVDYVNQQAEKYGLDLNQHQFDGLVDMVFNKGKILTPEKATFFKLIVEGSTDTDEIFYQFSRWNKVNGEFSLGVYRRSTDTANIFLKGEYNRDYPDTPDEYK